VSFHDYYDQSTSTVSAVRDASLQPRVLFISLEGIINGFLSLVYKQAVNKCVYKPPTKIASKGAGKWFKADFLPPDSKGKQLQSIPHLLAKKNCSEMHRLKIS
jgi:hypothetical protein